jgi:hypothetical protein
MVKEICLPVALGLALTIVGWGVLRRWREAAFWLALALVGQAATLQLIQAGTTMRYQHYVTAPAEKTFAALPPLALIVVACQTVLVLAGLRRRWSVILGWLRRYLKPWQLVLLVLVLYLPSAALSRETLVYLADVLMASWIQAVSLGNVLLLGGAWPTEAWPSLKRRFVSAIGAVHPPQQTSGRWDPVAWAAALGVTVVAASLSFFVYQNHPHIPDEVAYILHARLLASGGLTLPLPPVADAFEVSLMESRAGRWYPAPPPGWPAILALGVVVGLPWLVNPLLAGGNVLLAYRLIHELYDRRTARLVVGLLCVSPWHVFMAMNFLTHTATLTGSLVAALSLVWARRSGRAAWGFLGGSAIGVVSLIRPLDGAILVGLLGLWAIGLGGHRVSRRTIVALVLGSVIIGAVQLGYNTALTGSLSQFPINQYNDERFGVNSNAYGFGPDRGMPWPLDPHPGHGPRDATINAALNSFSVNVELLGWPTGSLLLAAFLVVSGRLRRSDWVLLTVVAVVFTVYFFYYFSGGPDFGARYWYLMLIPGLALTARGMECLSGRIGGGRVAMTVLALCVLTLVNYLPWRVIDKYYHYLNMRPDILTLARENHFEGGLVFIRGKRHPDYASTAVYNPLDLRTAATIYAWDRSAEVLAQTIAAYPGRPIWLVNGPTLTGRSYEVVAGPLIPTEALAARRANL